MVAKAEPAKPTASILRSSLRATKRPAMGDLHGFLTGKWLAGPGFVTFLGAKPLRITTGFLLFNIWSFAGDENRSDVNAMTLQPLLNYNLPKGWYLTTSPLMTANWKAANDNRWTVPVGGGVGRIFEAGHQALNARLSAYYNVVKLGAPIGSRATVDVPFSEPLSGRLNDRAPRQRRAESGLTRRSLFYVRDCPCS
jgi:hypothetical protein